MGYIENLKKWWALTAVEKKELDKIRDTRAGFQRDLEIASLLGSEDRLESTSGVIEDLSRSRGREMRKVWERRKRALWGK